MEKHITIVGVLHTAYSLMGLLAAFIVFIAIAGGGFLSGDLEAIQITSSVAGIIGSFILLLSLPGLIGGIGLLMRKPWARILLLIVGALGLLSIPFGTALGIYTIWALTRPEVVAALHGVRPPPPLTRRIEI
jgi:hypothetical protein